MSGHDLVRKPAATFRIMPAYFFGRLRRVAVLADAEIDQDRRRDEDRGVGADQHDAEHHDRREAVDRMAAEQQQRQQRQRHRDVGDDRARQRRIDGFVEQLRHRHFLVTPQHFPDPVIDHDGVVQGVAEDRQQRRDTGEVEIDLGDRHEADRQHDVVDVGDHGAERELPFEPEPEIDQDRKDREHQAEHAVGQQFAGNARTHHFDAAIFDGCRRARRAPSCTAACCAASPPGCSATRIRTSAGPPNCCKLNVAEAETAQASHASWRYRPSPIWTAPPAACRP